MHASPFVHIMGEFFLLNHDLTTMKILERHKCINFEELSKRQHSAYRFMEDMVRTQKATEKQLNRFLALLVRPDIVEEVALVIPELQLDKSVTHHKWRSFTC